MSEIDYQQIITVDPDKLGGKPCIRGHRFSVHDLFDYLAGGMSMAELFDAFPFLTPQDVQACFAWAADIEHRTFYATAS